MITIRMSGPKGDTPELAGEVAEFIEALAMSVQRFTVEPDPASIAESTDVVIIITQEEPSVEPAQ